MSPERSRNYGALFVDGVCQVCQQPRSLEGEEFHARTHLANGTAVTVSERGVTRVVPTSSLPEIPEEPMPFSGKRKLDPQLRKLVALARKSDARARAKGKT